MALAALDRSVALHPYDAQGHFVKGMVAIAASNNGYAVDDQFWKSAFQEAVRLNPSYAKGVTNQILSHGHGAASDTLRAVIPARAASYYAAAQSCFGNGAVDVGLVFLREGEEMKKTEIGHLWEEYVRSKGRGTEEGEAILRDILSLDSKYPRALLEKKMVAEALKMQERRDGQMAGLSDLNNLQRLLKDLQRREESKELLYYQARVEEELANNEDAVRIYRRILDINPQHFPTWVHLRNLMKSRARTPGDGALMESIERKISLFGMDSIPASSWNLRSYTETTTWNAAFRCEHLVNDIVIEFETGKMSAWKLMVDGRFIAAWKGSKKEKVSINIPAGEHEMELVYFGKISELEKRQAPFSFLCGF